jgi:16S rRNA (adenine1518-N6/adenine1519-N6)-dimethyltransferase
MIRDALPPLREVLRSHGLIPSRRLGQNFIFNLELLGRIAEASGSVSGATVIEVGPGPGGLTRALLALGAQKVIVVERDKRCLPILDDIERVYPGQLTIHAGDACETPLLFLLGHTDVGSCRIISNLPYNVGTKLLIQWISDEQWPPPWESITVLLQREVAERIVATLDMSKAYGWLSILCGWRTKAKILFDVGPENFVPPPQVLSSVIELIPKPEPTPCSVISLKQVTQAAFHQRRKMIRQSLKTLCGDPLPLLHEAGVNPTHRAEDLSIEDYVAIANVWSKLNKKS